MPDSRSLIERGIRLERGGVLAEALRTYAVAAEIATRDEDLSEALRRRADVHRLRCEWERAHELAMSAERVARDAGLIDSAGEAINARAAIAQSQGDHARARALYQEVLTVAQAPHVRGCALQNLGSLAAMGGDQEAAARFFEESLNSFRSTGYKRGIAIALNNLGRALLDRGDAERAVEFLEPAVHQARTIEDLDLAAVAVVNLAEALVACDQLDRAEDEISGALGFFKVSGNVWRQVECLKILGDARRARGEIDTARRLYEQAWSHAERVGERHEAAQVAARLRSLLETSEPPHLEAQGLG